MNEGIKKALIAGSDAERERIAAEYDENQTDTRYETYHYARNAVEWWGIVDMWWPEISLIFERYAPMSECPAENGVIIPMRLREYLVKLKAARDRKFENYLQKVWFAAPDSGSIHALPGWDVLCDLCSESAVLWEDERAEEETESSDQTKEPSFDFDDIPF